MAEPFVTLEQNAYEALQQELQLLRQQVVSLHQAKWSEPFQLARYKTLFNVIGTIRASLDLSAIFQNTVREVRQLLNADRVAIFRFIAGSGCQEGEFVSEDVKPSYDSALAAKVRDRCFGERHARYYAQGQIQAIDDIDAANLSPCHRDILARFQVKANLIVPLTVREELWGLLCVHQCSAPRQWQPEDIEFIQEIALNLGVTIQHAELFETSQKQAQELQELNQELETKVAQRTADLWEVNQALQAQIHKYQQAEAALKQLNEELEARVEERTQKLKETELRLQNVAANIPGVIYQFRLDPQGEMSFPYASSGCRQLLELEPEQMDESFQQVYPEDWDGLQQHILESAQTLKPFKWEWRIVTPSGILKWLQGIARPERQADQVVLWDGILIDISDRKQTEAILQLYQRAVESTSDAIGIADPAGHHFYHNPAFAQLYGYATPEEFNQQGGITQVFVNPDMAQAVVGTIQRGETWVGEAEHRSKGDRRMQILLRADAIKDANHQIIGLISVNRDITESRRAELQLRQQTENLKAALHELQRTQTQLVQSEKLSSLGQLVAGVAHEINNPVNFIYGNINHIQEYAERLLEVIAAYQQAYPHPSAIITDLIEDIELDFIIEDLPKLIDSMKIGSQRIRSIIASLRNFSRLDEAEFKAVNIHEGIDSTLMILQNRLKPKPEHPGIITIKEYGDLPPVECYPGQLNQVFMNILVNAIDVLEELYSSRTSQVNKQNPGQIKIQTQLLSCGSKVRISIVDNGLGMPENIRQKIFDPFFTTKPIGQGTGLGMSISYQIVTEKHQGIIQCFSEPGTGTEFVIDLPLRKF